MKSLAGEAAGNSLSQISDSQWSLFKEGPQATTNRTRALLSIAIHTQGTHKRLYKRHLSLPFLDSTALCVLSQHKRLFNFFSLVFPNREEKMKRGHGSAPKLERKTVEKNRRIHMKNLCGQLASLIPSQHHSRVCQYHHFSLLST